MVIVRIGIIGAGNIVESIHVPILKTITSVRIDWIYDLNAKRASLLSKMYSLPVTKEVNIEAAIQQVDLILIAIPYGARSRYLEICIKYQKGVYVEKPLAKTVSEHLLLVESFTRFNIAVGFQRRYYSKVTKLNSIFESSVFGKLKRISYSQGYFSLKGGSGYISNSSLSGGGILIESAIHALDQILFITSAKDLKVLKLSRIQNDGIDYDTAATTLIKTTVESEVLVEFKISTLRNLDNQIYFYYDNATVVTKLDIESKISILVKDQISLFEVNFERDKSAKNINESFRQLWLDFIEAFSEKKLNHSLAETSLLTTKWIEQLYK